MVEKGSSFTFETVLSTDRNFKLLEKARAKGYFIKCFYALTVNPEINILRVRTRAAVGGHSVPAIKIRQRYNRALKLIPRLLDVCDICHIYDNSKEPFRIFKKRKDQLFIWKSNIWSRKQIIALITEETWRHDYNGKR